MMFIQLVLLSLSLLPITVESFHPQHVSTLVAASAAASVSTCHSLEWWTTGNNKDYRRRRYANFKINIIKNKNDNDKDSTGGGENSGSRTLQHTIPSTLTTSVLRFLRKHWQRGNSNNNNRNNDNVSNVSMMNHLPLRSAFIAIGVYLLIGVMGYRFTSLVHPTSHNSIIDIIYLCCVCLSTVGYGDVIPITTTQKIFTILYGMGGILLWSSAIATIGTKLIELETKTATSLLKQTYKHRFLHFDIHMPTIIQNKHQKRGQQENNNDSINKVRNENILSELELLDQQHYELSETTPNIIRKTKAILQLLPKPLFVILSCGYVIGKVEGWSIIDVLYYSFITATTIGFGDIVPTTQLGRCFASLLIPAFVAAAAQLFASITQLNLRMQQQQVFQTEYTNGFTQQDVISMDFTQDGKVSEPEYILWNLMAMGIVDKTEVTELGNQFKKFDVTQSGFIEVEDLRIMEELRNKQRQTPSRDWREVKQQHKLNGDK